MSDYEWIDLTIPVAIKDAANNCAAIMDFDSGGGSTFGSCGVAATAEGPVTHYTSNVPMKPHYIPLLKDPVQAMAALTALATQYGRDLPVQADVEAFCAGVTVGPAGLVRVIDEIEQ